MVCKNCGKEIPDSNNYCQFCNNGIDLSNKDQSSEIAETEINSDVGKISENKIKKLKKRYFISVAIVLSIILITFGARAAFDLFKTPKQQYMQVEQKNFKVFADELKTGLENAKNADAVSLKSKPYECKTEFSIGADIKDIPGIDPSYSGSIGSILNKIKFTNDSKIDIQNKKFLNDFKIMVQDNPLITASIVQNNMQIGVSLPVLYNKFFTADLSDMKTLYKNLGIQDTGNIPNKTITQEDLTKAIKINKEDVNSLLKKYGKLYYESLDEKSVILEKNTTFTVDSEKIACRKFTLSLDEKQFKTLIEIMYNTLSEDDKLIDLTQGNVANILNLYKDAGVLNSLPDMGVLTDKATFKENLKSFKKTLKEELDKVKLPNGFKMTLWVDKKNTILSRSFSTDIISGTDNNTVNTTLEMKKWTSQKDNSKNKSIGLLLTSTKDNRKLDFNIVTKSALDENRDNGNENINVNWTLTGSNTPESKMNFNLNSKKSKDKITNDGKVDLQFDFSLLQDNNDFSGNGNILTTSWANKKSKTDGYSSAIKINFKEPGSEEDSLSLNANIKQDYAYGIDFKLPELNESNSVNLNNVNKTELDGVIQEIQGSVQKFFYENLNLFS